MYPIFQAVTRMPGAVLGHTQSEAVPSSERRLTGARGRRSSPWPEFVGSRARRPRQPHKQERLVPTNDDSVSQEYRSLSTADHIPRCSRTASSRVPLAVDPKASIWDAGSGSRTSSCRSVTAQFACVRRTRRITCEARLNDDGPRSGPTYKSSALRQVHPLVRRLHPTPDCRIATTRATSAR